ncbi:hypothetical protein BGW39_011570 [Mortierella sp. 14UC]|nr:hypothetical protein BGW39_011570 [Mortierella sp. 14UC]
MLPQARTFFQIPELVLHTLTYLDRSDLLSLALTSRHCSQLALSDLNRDLVVRTDLSLVLLLNNDNALSRIGQYMQRTRSLETWAPFLAAYINGFARPPSTSTSAQSPTPAVTTIAAPNWLPEATTATIDDVTVALPPMRRLRRLSCDLMTCWLLRLNPRLTSVTIDRMNLRSPQELNRLSHALGSLEELSELEVGPLPIVNQETGGRLLRLFFDSLPSSLTSLTMSQTSSRMADKSEDAWIQRQGNLGNLRTLRLDCPHYLTLPFLRHVLECCPVLETLGIMTYETVLEPDGVLTILTSFRQQALRFLHMDHLEGRRPNRAAQKAIKQHRSTLREIRFQDCREMEQRTYTHILKKCQHLERLQVDQAGAGAGGMRLRHLVRVSWVCQNLTRLEMTVSAAGFHDPSYLHHLHCKFSPVRADTKEWERWTEFYWKVGQLQRLKVLRLRRQNNETLPAMLALGCIQRKRLGFLQLLRNLRELREFRRSFHLDIPEVEASFGVKEARWVARNWPQLMTMELLRPQGNIEECLEKFPQLVALIEAKPWLNLA